MKLRGCPFFSSFSRTYTTYAAGRGSKEGVRFFQNMKMTMYFSKIINLLLFFIRTLLEEGGGLQNKYVLYTRENDEENG